MKTASCLWMAAVVFALAVAGCKDATPEKAQTSDKAETPRSPDEKYAANLAKLEPADRKLAEAQKFCAVDNESRLGSMGAPFKVMVKDQPVFLCCKSCQKSALADPDKTLAKVEELKKKSAEPAGK
jgi:hypothetical protein